MIGFAFMLFLNLYGFITIYEFSIIVILTYGNSELNDEYVHTK